MCRHFVMIDTNKKPVNDELKYYIILNYVKNSYDKANNDGYFLRVDNKIIRTIDFEKYINFIIKNKNKINNAKVIHGHLRLATTIEKGVDGVHGWLINNYYCSHNGIIENKLSKEVDSLSFFELVKHNDTDEMLQKIKSELETSTGGGSFYLTNNNKVIIVSKDKANNFHLVNDYLLVINSNDDIHHFTNKLKINRKEIMSKFGLQFVITKTKEVMFDKVKILKDAKYESNDEIVLINLLTNKTRRIFVDTITYENYDKHKEYGYYGYDDYNYV